MQSVTIYATLFIPSIFSLSTVVSLHFLSAQVSLAQHMWKDFCVGRDQLLIQHCLQMSHTLCDPHSISTEQQLTLALIICVSSASPIDFLSQDIQSKRRSTPLRLCTF
ncbi:hypothetical protein AB6A40_009210 [Gnathostoma spinigerum]|uniref:Secreted protein n=1 Tax=Gnathostoma spinigerum TaxID=75299 RepID=A0ABD6ET56_9BILA